MFSRIRSLTRTRLGRGQTHFTSSIPRHTLTLRATRYHNHVPSRPQYNQASFPPDVRLPTLKELYLFSSQKLISWEKYSVALAILGGVGIGSFYYTHLQDVLFTKRKQFNCTSLESASEWMLKNDAESCFNILSIGTLSKYAPEQFLSDDHPSSVAVFGVIKRILAAGHLNLEDRIWALGIIVSNAQISLGDRLEYAGITGLIVIDSSILSDLENEGALAGFLSKKLAPLVLRHHEEKLSHRRFLFCALIPAVPLIITSMVKRSLLVIAGPYVAAYAAAWWSFRKLQAGFNDESIYVSMRLVRQLGYDLNDYVRYVENLINDNEQMLRKGWQQLEAEYGPNLPVEVEEGFREVVKEVEEQKAKFQKIKELVPKIMAETANDAIIRRESKKIPLVVLERPEDPPQQTE